MYVLIVPHPPDKHCRMQVDSRNMVLDLSGVAGSLVDPTIARVEWAFLQDGKNVRPGGLIYRDGQRTQRFYDESALAPYLAEFEAEWRRRQTAQDNYVAPQPKTWQANPPDPIAYEGA